MRDGEDLIHWVRDNVKQDPDKAVNWLFKGELNKSVFKQERTKEVERIIGGILEKFFNLRFSDHQIGNVPEYDFRSGNSKIEFKASFLIPDYNESHFACEYSRYDKTPSGFAISDAAYALILKLHFHNGKICAVLELVEMDRLKAEIFRLVEMKNDNFGYDPLRFKNYDTSDGGLGSRNVFMCVHHDVEGYKPYKILRIGYFDVVMCNEGVAAIDLSKFTPHTFSKKKIDRFINEEYPLDKVFKFGGIQI